ncbi:hypothetical protein [Streptomyces sp. NPDC051997]|uniref:hypothetical protein n=1 Tax=Streptomyces sp. NPDC051997 TaxID=3155611 RepID=UPI003441EDC7
MEDWTVEFDPASGIAETDQGEIRSALRNIACTTTPKAGHWPGGLDEVWVLGRLAGGRSGSEVVELRLDLKDGSHRLQVAKLSNRAEAIEEYTNAAEVAQPERFPMHLAIVAASRGVLDQSPDCPHGQGLQAVVYQHVADRHGGRGATRSLEQVIAAGVLQESKLESARVSLRQVMEQLADQMHTPQRRQQASLGPLNRTLGTDLYLKFERVSPTGDDEEVGLDLGITSPSREEVEQERCHADDLLRNSSSPPGGRRTLSIGQRVTVVMDDLDLSEHAVKGRVDTAAVQAQAGGTALKKNLRAEFKDKTSLLVNATVVATRAQRRSRLMTSFLNGLGTVEEREHELVCDGVSVAHPLRSLFDILRAAKEDRGHSPVHGDLNPRNVLLRGESAYLIDFASAQPDGLLLTDYAWLEVCVLRELESAGLSWLELIQLQRQLAVLSLLAVQVDSDCLDKILAAVVDVRGGHAGRCLALLWEIRQAALQREIAAGVSAEVAHLHLFQHLTLAALRPLKFPESDQSPYKAAVCAVVAGVASEALNSPLAALFAAWDPGEIAAFGSALLDSSQAHLSRCVDVLIGIRLACRAARNPGWGTDADTALVRAIMRGPLHAPLEQQREHTPLNSPFITLTGRMLPPGEPLLLQGDGALAMGPSSALDLLAGIDQHVVLVGDCGAGKTVTVQELQARLLRGGLDPGQGDDVLPPYWPIEVSAQQISAHLKAEHQRLQEDPEAAPPLCTLADDVSSCCTIPLLPEAVLACMLDIGAVYLVLDQLHKVDTAERPVVLAWISELSQAYPSVRIAVCQRASDYQPDVLRWPAIALHKVRAQQAEEYIEDRLRQDEPLSWRPRMQEINRALFQDPEAGGLRDLATKPLFLSIMVEHHLKGNSFRTTNPGRLVEDYILGLMGDVDAGESGRRMKLFEQLARDMDEFGAAIRYEDALKSLDRLRPPNAGLTLEALLRTTAIVTDPARTWITFGNPIIHAYFAAAVLSSDPGTVADRVLQFHWREAAQLLVANPQAPQDVVRLILETALDANSVYGAWLLQAAPADKFTDLRGRLVQTLTAQLEAEDSGQPAWRQAAYGLAKYGTPTALAALCDAVLRDIDAPAAAEALDGLVMMHQWFVPDAGSVLSTVLCHLLDLPDDEISEDLAVRAVRSIATAGLRPLVGHVWDRIHSGTPWPVIRQAWQALEKMRVRPSSRLRAVYAEACRTRLAAAERELSRAAAATTAQSLCQEQRELLAVLAGEGDLERVLSHRFRAGLADDAAWHDLVTRAGSRCTDSALKGLLDSDDTDWLALLLAENETHALLAAHVLLHRGQSLPVDVLGRAAAAASPSRLLALAHFVHGLNGDEASAVDNIVRSYADKLDEGYLEPLSVLVGAVSNLDLEARPRAALLVEEAARRPGLAPSLYWPWTSAWRESVPDRTDVALFLDAPQLSDDEALKLISATDVLLDAPPFDPLPLSDDHRERLADLKPEDPTSLDAHRFVMLAATTGLHHTLDYVRTVAEHPDNATAEVVHSHPLHGEVAVVPAAHAIAAIGYLSLLAAEDHSTASQKAFSAHKELDRMFTDLASAHVSLRRARLIGMGFLGDWMEILERLEPEDPVMHHAAHNIVMHWLPGPCSPPTSEKDHLVGVARWIRERLRQRDIPSPTRAALVHIRDSAETQLGRYVR